MPVEKKLRLKNIIFCVIIKNINTLRNISSSLLRYYSRDKSSSKKIRKLNLKF